jgi:hypothetical protein
MTTPGQYGRGHQGHDVTPKRLSVCDAVLERLAYTLKYMAFEFGPLVPALKPIMGQGYLFRGRFPNCKRHVLEILCQPSEERVIYIPSPELLHA